MTGKEKEQEFGDTPDFRYSKLQIMELRETLPVSSFPRNVYGPLGSNLFVFHVPTVWTEVDLQTHFCSFGQLVSVRIKREAESGRSLGYGFVSYSHPLSAARALMSMDRHTVDGKSLRVTTKRGEAVFLAEAVNMEFASNEAIWRQGLVPVSVVPQHADGTYVNDLIPAAAGGLVQASVGLNGGAFNQGGQFAPGMTKKNAGPKGRTPSASTGTPASMAPFNPSQANSASSSAVPAATPSDAPAAGGVDVSHLPGGRFLTGKRAPIVPGAPPGELVHQMTTKQGVLPAGSHAHSAHLLRAAHLQAHPQLPMGLQHAVPPGQSPFAAMNVQNGLQMPAYPLNGAPLPQQMAGGAHSAFGGMQAAPFGSAGGGHFAADASAMGMHHLPPFNGAALPAYGNTHTNNNTTHNGQHGNHHHHHSQQHHHNSNGHRANHHHHHHSSNNGHHHHNNHHGSNNNNQQQQQGMIHHYPQQAHGNHHGGHRQHHNNHHNNHHHSQQQQQQAGGHHHMHVSTPQHHMPSPAVQAQQDTAFAFHGQGQQQQPTQPQTQPQTARQASPFMPSGNMNLPPPPPPPANGPLPPAAMPGFVPGYN